MAGDRGTNLEAVMTNPDELRLDGKGSCEGHSREQTERNPGNGICWT